MDAAWCGVEWGGASSTCTPVTALAARDRAGRPEASAAPGSRYEAAIRAVPAFVEERLYRDLFVDRLGPAQWNLQPAPSLFPDAIVFFLLRALTGRTFIALALYTSLVATTIAVVTAYLGRLSGASPWASRVAGIVATCAVLESARYDWIFAYAVVPSAHGASLLVGLLVLALVARQLRANRLLPWSLLGVVILSGATLAFDRIFLVFSGAPIALAVVFCSLFGVVRWREGAWAALALALAATLSLLGPPFLRAFEMTSSPLSHHDIDASWGAVGADIHFLDRWNCHPVVAATTFCAGVLTLLGGIGVGGRAIREWMRRGRRPSAYDKNERTTVLIAVAAVGSMLCTFVATAVTHALWEDATIRYLQPLFIVPLIALPLFVALAPNVRGRLFVVAALSISAAVLFRAQKKAASLKPTEYEETLYPADVTCVEKLAVETNAHYGYAEYWQAHRITELSHDHVRLVPVNGNVSRFEWISDKRWYTELVARQPRFLVLMVSMDERSVRDHFGAPTRTIQCPDPKGSVVWFYDRHSPPVP